MSTAKRGRSAALATLAGIAAAGLFAGTAHANPHPVPVSKKSAANSASTGFVGDGQLGGDSHADDATKAVTSGDNIAANGSSIHETAKNTTFTVQDDEIDILNDSYLGDRSQVIMGLDATRDDDGWYDGNDDDDEDIYSSFDASDEIEVEDNDTYTANTDASVR